MDLVELNAHYSTEDKCREQLKRLPVNLVLPFPPSQTSLTILSKS